VGLVALAGLFLTRGPVQAGPLPPFLFASVLFMAPGLLLSAPLSGEGFLARLPVAFALSTGLFGLLALPVLLSHRSLDLYLVLCGVVVALSLASAAVLLGRDAPGRPGPAALQRPAFGAGYALLLVLFLAVAGVLAAISVTRVPGTGEDAWVYLSYVREYLAGGRLGAVNPYTGGEYGSFTRLTLNGWLVVQAAFARVCGLDPIDLVGNYLTPVLVVVSLLAFYALARTVTGGSRAALFASILYAIPFLATLDYSLLSAGGEFVGRGPEDKFLARFVFLPVALIFAVKFLEEPGGGRKKWRYLLLFAFLSYAAVVVHPLGFALIGLSFAAAAPVHLVLSRRERAAWTGVLALGAVLLGAAVPALLYFLLQTGGVPSMLEATSENRTAFLLYAWERGERLLRLGEGSFIMHPSLLLQPAVLGAYLIGLPHLLLQAKGSVPARFLLGNLLLMPMLLYVPPIATFVGGIVGPWTLWRLAWPLQLAAALALVWALWDLLGYARRLTEGRTGGLWVVVRRAAAILPLALLVALLAAVSPAALTGARAVRTTDETAQGQSLCTDPALRWLDGELKETGVVLTPGNESRCLAAQAVHAHVTNLQELAVARDEEAIEQDLGRQIEVSSVTQGADQFYRSPTVDREMLGFLRRRKVDLVLLPVDSPLVAQLDHLPGFERLEAPGERYVFFGVSWRDLAVSPIVGANTRLNDGEYERAIEAYAAAPSRGPDDDFLALLGTGRASVELGRYDEAVTNLERAVETDPESTSTRGLLAEARSESGDERGAREAYEEAIRGNPRNVQVRLDYGLSLLLSDPDASIQAHREIVRMYPRVPEYRLKLGAALGLLGHREEADRELGKAVEIDPLSPQNHADVGTVYASTNRPREAAGYYERALDLDPRNQEYAYELGRVLAGLSAEDTGDGDLFEKAEENLQRVDELQPLPREPDNRSAAQLALGDLYAAHDRPEDARRAYEEALRLDPENEEARGRLEELEER
jgi:tetratricopeptide (TPR) repeat protein